MRLKFSIVVALIVAFMAQSIMAQTFNITDFYWIVGDSGPTTNVFSSKRGLSVVNSDATYLSWLTAGNGQSWASVTGAADNGAGLIRLAVNTSSTFSTGQKWNVSGVLGTTEANANWTVTVVDSTHIDLQGSTFSHAYTGGGTISGPQIIDTQAHLYSVFDSYANTLAVPGYSNFSAAGPIQLANPVALFNSVFATDDLVNMPQQNLPTSIPLGRSILIFNADGTNSLTVRLFDATTTLVTIPPNGIAGVVPVGNTDSNGTWNIYYLGIIGGFNGVKTIRNSAGSGTCTMTFTNGLLASSTC